MIYNIWKLLHIIAAIIFIGNIIIGTFWKLQADKSKDRLKILETFRILIKADRIFTMPSVALLFVFGAGAAMQGNYSLIETPWILWGIVMLSITGYVFMSKIVPLQKQIIKFSDNPEKFSLNEYSALTKKWNFWESIAITATFIALILMVIKPIL